MIRFIRDLRLIPIALIASACLLALKTADLVLDSPYFFVSDNSNADDGDVSVVRSASGAMASAGSPDSWAKQMFNFPDGKGAASPQNLPRITARRSGGGINADRDNLDITGSVSEPAASAAKPGAKPGDKPGDKPDAKPEAGSADAKAPPGPPGKDAKAPPPSGMVIPAEGPPPPTGAERAILERLQQRREELDTRARELDMRESLIQSAEKRMDLRLSELKDVEARIKTETQQKSEAENVRLKGLITMYENMKPRDAAKIFNGLEDGVLLDVASKMNPRTMAEILAQMQADVAQHLTVELASKAQQAPQPGATAAELPKIDGQPTPK
jgi:flagellar motility protein MotE (MotC chaperone)